MSQIINVLSYLYSVFSSVVQFDLGLLFKSIKINSLLMSPICCVVANGLRRSLNISNPLEMLY